MLSNRKDGMMSRVMRGATIRGYLAFIFLLEEDNIQRVFRNATGALSQSNRKALLI